MLHIIGILWGGCAIFNLIIFISVFSGNSFEEQQKILIAEHGEKAKVSRTEVLLISVLLAPIFTFMLITAGGSK